MHPAVFLDRDGVLNRPVVREGKPYPPQSLDELDVLPGVPEAVVSLHEARFSLIMVTNQPDVARGTQSQDVVDAINDRLKDQLGLDAVYVCYHDDGECTCRKPQPGMLTEAAQTLDLDLPSSFMVGDRWRDIEAGSRAGCRTVMIDYGYDEALTVKPDKTVSSLEDAATWILAVSGHKTAD